MSMAEILRAVRALPQSEKVELVRLLLNDLAGEELLSGVRQGQEFPIYTSQFAPGAAAQLARALTGGEETIMGKNAYFISSENTEDRFDEVNSLEEAIRIARAVARESQTGDPISIEHRGRVIRQLVLMPDGRISEEEIR